MENLINFIENSIFYVIFLGIIGLYLSKCIYILKDEEFLIITKFRGGQFKTVKKNSFNFAFLKNSGLVFVLWPFEAIRMRLEINDQSSNFKNIEGYCAVKDSSGKIISQILLKGAEVSVNWKINLLTTVNGKQIFNNKNVIRLFDITNEDINGNIDFRKEGSVFSETLKDVVEETIRAKISKMEVFEARKMDSNGLKDKIQIACLASDLPIKIISVKVNNPFDVADEKLAQSIKEIGEADFMKAQAKINMEKEKEIAEAQIEIKRLIAEGKAASMKVIAKAYGLDKLTTDQQSAALLKLKEIEAYENVGTSDNNTIVMSPQIASTLASIVKSITGGK